MRACLPLVLATMLAACSNPEQANVTNESSSAPNGATTVPPATAPAGRTVELPDDRMPLAEPRGAIDPKSAEAAGQVVQHYAALIEQRRFAEAEALWNDPASARKFAAELRAQYAETHLEIGKPGHMEGAAGSAYVTVPTVFYGKQKNGKTFRASADVTLRRVNDVPGSTDEQRRWHIQEIVWTIAG